MPADGRIQAVDRPGNARGNGLGGNQPALKEWPVTQYTWIDDGARVTVVAPLTQFGSRSGAKSSGDAPEKVTCLFTGSTFDLFVTTSKLFRLRVDNLPAGGIRAEVRLRLRRCLPRLVT
jgi:hypothetical protein